MSCKQLPSVMKDLDYMDDLFKAILQAFAAVRLRVDELESQLPITHEEWYDLCNKYDNASQKAAEMAVSLACAQATIAELWQIIDDIDTYGDMAKSDDSVFRSMVERRQKDRWKTGITTDGHTLTFQANQDALHEALARECERLANVFDVNGEHSGYGIWLREEAAAHRSRKVSA